METLNISTHQRTEFIDITRQVQDAIDRHKIKTGVVTVFCPHTTGGITINENADPDVTADMELVLNRMVPWTGDYAHGEGNTAAHVKASMMGASTHVLIEHGRLALGTWQAIYFCEFDGPRSRKAWISVTG